MVCNGLFILFIQSDKCCTCACAQVTMVVDFGVLLITFNNDYRTCVQLL